MLNSPAGIAAFRKLTQPIIDGYWAPLTLIQTMNNQAGNVFASGQAGDGAACSGSGARRFRANLLPQGDDFDVMHFPKGTTKRVTGMGTFGFALSAKAKNPDAAWSFLQFMYGEEGMRIITASVRLGAGDAAVLQQRVLARPARRRRTTTPSFVDAFAYGTTPPRIPFYSTGPFRQAVTDGIVAIVLGKATVEEVVANVDKELNTILAARR